MEVQKQEIPVTQKQTEKERLELVDKRVEIQRKRLEIRKEKLNMDDIIERKLISFDEQKILIEKITELRHLLSDSIIDYEKTIMGSEPFYWPTICGFERGILNNGLKLICDRKMPSLLPTYSMIKFFNSSRKRKFR